MPEVSRFYGILIFMFFNEHNPPHFHVTYGEFRITVEINTGVVIGKMPKRALNLIFEWMEQHKGELLDNWNRCQQGDSPISIEPLI
jgi:hypothetical protein